MTSGSDFQRVPAAKENGASRKKISSRKSLCLLLESSTCSSPAPSRHSPRFPCEFDFDSSPRCSEVRRTLLLPSWNNSTANCKDDCSLIHEGLKSRRYSVASPIKILRFASPRHKTESFPLHSLRTCIEMAEEDGDLLEDLPPGWEEKTTHDKRIFYAK